MYGMKNLKVLLKCVNNFCAFYTVFFSDIKIKLIEIIGMRWAFYCMDHSVAKQIHRTICVKCLASLKVHTVPSY
jgi:hypothetical protein